MMDTSYIEVFQQLSSICQKISKGDYSEMDNLFELTRIEKYPEVITNFSESFGMMLVKLQAREFELTQTIDELRITQGELELAKQRLQEENIYLKTQMKDFTIVIDKTKKEKDVSEITETDSFQEILKIAEGFKKDP